jgi:hypothetical protein
MAVGLNPHLATQRLVVQRETQMFIANAKTLTLLFVFVQHKRLMALVAGKDWVSVILSLWMTLALSLNALGLAWLIDHPAAMKIDTAALLHSMNVFLALMTFARSYFPSYRPTSQYIEPLFPVSKGIRTSANLLFDCISPYSLNMLLFCGILFATAHSFTLWHLLEAVCILCTAIILDRSLKVIMEYEVRLFAGHSTILLLCSVAFAAGLWSNFGGIDMTQAGLTTLPIHWLLCACVLPHHFMLVFATRCPRAKQQAKQYRLPRVKNGDPSPPSWFRLVLLAYYRVSHVQNLLALAALLKYSMLLGILISEMIPPERISNASYLFAMLSSTLFFFTYLFLNTFGFNWQLWQSVQNLNPRSHQSLWLYMAIVMPIVVVDMAISCTILWRFGVLTLQTITTLLTMQTYSILWAFVSSLLFPIKHERMPNIVGFNNRPVSQLSSLILIFCGFLLPNFFRLHWPHSYWLSILPSFCLCWSVFFIILSHRQSSFKIYYALHR